ncbi:MAG: EamA family transporter [candidate division NC10 bacterium]|nr:EamA family transporter [candidate division NC10 bacterium]
MTAAALGLVLAAALLHATWNLVLKQSSGKLTVSWLGVLAGALLATPGLLLVPGSLGICPAGWACILATGLLHALYFLFLSEAYERGELSLVYPLARGSGPLLVALLAPLLLGEVLTPGGATGIGLVVLGLFGLAGGPEPTAPGQSRLLAQRRAPHVAMALLTGLTIAGYSLVDKVGVGLVHPTLYQILMMGLAFLALTPYVLWRRRPSLASLKAEWRAVALVGVFSFVAYQLVLFALRLAKVAYVVAAREVSIVFGVALGAAFLGERHGARRLIAAASIAAGTLLIGLSR